MTSNEIVQDKAVIVVLNCHRGFYRIMLKKCRAYGIIFLLSKGVRMYVVC